ncbi:uncharacterized protein LOC141853054 [Brevipalpus obovatus]|uniref:uncharacterized protein LOC141853054 n=1 Tax=Brevipalpus obovatus TaxID=246614 RepID=UPI003D9FA225
MDRNQKQIHQMLKTRKQYNQLSKVRRNDGHLNMVALKSSIEAHKREMVEIEEELSRYRQEYNLLIQDIGQAHKAAQEQELKENLCHELNKRRDHRVKTHAEKVLSDEIQRARMENIRQKQEKENLLKRRQDLFRQSVPPKLGTKGACQIGLEEWKRIENLVNHEIDRLLLEEREDHPVEISEPVIRPKKFVRQAIQPRNTKKSVQIQTDLEKEKRILNMHAIENVVSRKIREKLNHLHLVPAQPVLCVPTVSIPLKEVATNTSRRESMEVSLQTTSHHLPLEKLPEAPTSQQIVKAYDDNRSPVGNALSELSDISSVDLKDLINQIKSIRTLIDDQKKAPVRAIERKKTPIEKHKAIDNDIMNRTFTKEKNPTFNPVPPSIKAPSPVQFDDCSTETVKNQPPNETITLSSDDEACFSGDDQPDIDTEVSLSSVSQCKSYHTSIEFSNFSRKLSVDKDLFWKEILDSAGIKAGVHQIHLLKEGKLEHKASSLRNFHFHSTPKVSRFTKNR